MKIQENDNGQVDRTQGSLADTTTRIILVVALCAFQYWLFLVCMEAYQDRVIKIVAVSFGASLLCFLLVLGLLIVGESVTKKLNQNRNLKEEELNNG